MITRITLSLIFFLSISSLLFSQDSDEKKFPFQFSLVYPVGSGGTNSTHVCYNFSLNALAGVTGSINGFEIGSILNVNKNNVSGVQISGIGNITLGNAMGFRVGGIFGTSHTFSGLQVNGILTGTNESSGVLISGIINLTKTSNVTIAGIANVNLQSVRGLQLAGIFNITNKLNGVQLGLINVVDSVEKGVSIGLVSIVRHNRYQQFSLSFADYMNVGVNYRTGTKTLYNIYSAGMNFLADPLWVAGFGFGHISEITRNFIFQPELTCYTYFPQDFRHIRETYVTHLKVGFSYYINDKFSITFAPSLYGALKSTEGNYEVAGYEQSPIGPIISHTSSESNSVFEAGFGVSIEFCIK